MMVPPYVIKIFAGEKPLFEITSQGPRRLPVLWFSFSWLMALHTSKGG